MKRHFKWDKKYLYWGITLFCVIACSILFFMALNYISSVGAGLKALAHILSPFIWGLIISYLLYPLVKSLERNAFGPLGDKIYKTKKKSSKSFARGFSVLVSELVMLAVVAALVYLILPQLYNSIEKIVLNSNKYLENLTMWVTKLLEDYPEIEQVAASTIGTLNTNVMKWLNETILPKLGNIISSLTAGVYYVVMGIYNLVIGIIVSVYVLGNMEGFKARGKRLLYSLLSVEKAEKFREVLAFTDKTFIGFINGKLLDSAIIGLICYIVCAILKMPYAMLVSVIVGVTNIIPFFGPFIGAVPSAIIILMESPVKCLIFIVFIIILQQVDGNIIGPKILGSSIGINGFWVMFSIILGAGLFGFWGMLLGVPVFVVIYTAINAGVEKRLKENDLPWEEADYADMDHIDPISRQIIKKPQGSEYQPKRSRRKAEKKSEDKEETQE